MTCDDYFAQHRAPLALAVRQFLAQQLDYDALQDVSWQLLGQWQSLPRDCADKQADSPQESVFWHLLHSLHLWNQDELAQDPALRHQLHDCAACLLGEGPAPLGCIGTRP
ncbi:hypothetical protein M2366_001168 [Aeromonas sp. BIGb0405]|uniref:hypothetical protein n=1 Tax=Aeromonas TaxID=642 RepID=UPI001CCC6BD3|nr:MULTISPECIES: hypothetical protein [Aeromonas]MCS3455101.1 hypothetical protein [Aeromonas sp. BIGb0405]MCS3458081.1 hypothetical protein [Aeromonas sp. BIGb0445]UBO73159.1 hypothetical protein KYK33_15080 [Aeromonas rivuli]